MVCETCVVTRVKPRPYSSAKKRFSFRSLNAVGVQYVVLGFLLFSVAFPIGVAKADSKFADFAVTRWTRENGLPDNSVTCLMQTLDGFIWIGTEKGLARF